MVKSDSYKWALPEDIDIEPDKLRARLDFYQESIVLYLLDANTTTTHMVSGREVITALLSEVPLGTGILPQGALWWQQGNRGVEIGLWEPPQVWTLSLMVKQFEPPRRFKIPMPGLVFGCIPARAPRVYAAKKRPEALDDVLYHAPLFNIFMSGETCAGTNKYPSNVLDIPKSFMVSFFTAAANHEGRSKTCKSLLSLWEYLEGKKKYPMSDLVKVGTMEEIMNARRMHT